MTTKRRTPSYTNHNGFLMPAGFPAENFISGLSYQAQSGDTFITTYPKCGTTWTQHIVWLLQNDGKPLPLGKTIGNKIPFLELVGKEVITALPSPRFIKTHLPFSMNPYHPEAKYIYVARNPFDCVVSFYHHTRGFVELYNFADGTFDDFFEGFITGKVDFGDYFDNLLSWYEHKNDSNVLFLTYEYLKENTREGIIKIAYFLGDKCLNTANNPENLNNIILQSSFENMSKNQSRWHSTKRPENMPPFIRKGQVGDWKNHFSSEQIKRLTEKFITRTKGTEISNLWKDIIPT
ncbi:MAG: sulfotransferase domain-containing protein [Prochloraceae cyanobacterium]|nr:sulfotransferase domain-containing protein [Prochloraceae cyanobacterium]